MPTQLTVTNLSKQFDPPNGQWVLKDLSLEAHAGETIAIVGPSGSGKSTLLNIIGSLDQATAGTVQLNCGTAAPGCEIDITTLTPETAATYRSKHVGFVFQDHHLLPQLTGTENVLLPTLANRTRSVSEGRSDHRERAAELIERVRVTSRAHAFPAELSGGERQRLAIARALINFPELLLCDEPTGNLDHDNALAVINLFAELAKIHGVIILMATHNLELANRFDRILELKDGQLQNTSSIPSASSAVNSEGGPL